MHKVNFPFITGILLLKNCLLYTHRPIIRHLMKNLLILIVAIAIFLHFYPQPEVDEFYEDSLTFLDETFGDTFDTQSRLDPKKILIDLKSDIPTFKIKERAKLEELASSRQSLKAFYDDYCTANKRAKDYRPYVQQKICKTIAKYRKLL